MVVKRCPVSGRPELCLFRARLSVCVAMGLTDQSQHAIRRSTRLPLEVPVRVTSLDPAVPLAEDCNTTLVNAHGCGLIAKREIPRGLRVRLEIVSARRHTTAVVSEMVTLGGDPETWLIGLELDVPGNFWGIDYAPADWKIDETPPPLVTRPRQAERTDKPGRRWRLTDISTGACYLETMEPFAAGTPVLLSIRASNSECLLDGMVRIAYPQTGMGVEFTDPEQKTRIEQLIHSLMETREVPRIFVGHKEGQQKMEALRQPAQRFDEEAPDPLLQLVREGPTLTAEQFLSDLRAQRLGKRRDPRIDVAVPVLLTGTDEGGKPLSQRVTTMNISRRGAQLQGVHGRLRPGDRVGLTRGRQNEFFRVAWVGAEGSPVEGQIGVSATEAASNFWDEILQVSIEAQEQGSLSGSSDENGS
jgi:hypothetical protein